MQPSIFNVRVPLPERNEVFLMNTLNDAQLLVSPEVTELLDRYAHGGLVSPANDDDVSERALWTLEPADGASLRIKYRGTTVASARYLFWGSNFSWADTVVKNIQSAQGVTTFEADVLAGNAPMQAVFEL